LAALCSVFLFIRTLFLATQKARVMLIVLIVAGSLWLLLAGVMVLSLAGVARQASPEISFSSELAEEEFCGEILSRDFLDDTVDQEALLNIEAETGATELRDPLLSSSHQTQWQSSWRSPLI
jgi:hypothetical protein